MSNKKRNIIAGILISVLIINIIILLDVEQKNRLDSFPVSSLNSAKLKIQDHSQFPKSSITVEENLSHLRQDIEEIDSIFKVLKSGNYAGGDKENPIPDSVISTYQKAERDWENYSQEIKSVTVPTHGQRLETSINYVLEKNEKLIPLTNRAIEEVSNLDNHYDRHKEIVNEIKVHLQRLDSTVQMVSSGEQDGSAQQQINEQRVKVESSIRKLLQVPLDDLELESLGIKEETLTPIPRQNSDALKEIDFIWESVQLRLRNIESGTLIPSSYALSVDKFTPERELLINSLESVVNSWNKEIDVKLSERIPMIYSLFGMDVVVVASSLLLLVKRKRGLKLEIKAEIVSKPEVSELEVPKVEHVEPDVLAFWKSVEPEVKPEVPEIPEVKPVVEPFSAFWDSIEQEIEPVVELEPAPEAEIEPVVEPEPKSIPQIILKILKEKGEMNNDQIYNEIVKINPDVKRDAMRGRLSELRRRGVIKRNEDGFWRVEKLLEKGMMMEQQIKELIPVKSEQLVDKASKLYQNGLSLLNEGKYDDAMKIFDEILEFEPKHLDALFKKGIALNRLYKYDDALLCYNKIIEINPNHVDALFYKGLALSVLGRHDESISFYDEVLAIKPNHQNAWINKGISLSILGRGTESIPCFEKVLESEPNNFEALYHKGETLEKLSKYDEALSCFEKVLEFEPNHQTSLFYKGKILSQRGKHDEALIFYDKVLKSDPEHFEALYHKGLTLSILGGLEKAIECFDKILKNMPNQLDAFFNKGFTLALLGKYKESIIIFEKVFEIYPNYPKALVGMIYSHFNIKEYEKSLEYCDKVLEFEPSNAVAHYNKSRIYAIQNRIDDALIFLKQSISENLIYKESAKKELAFKDLMENPMFKFLTEN